MIMTIYPRTPNTITTIGTSPHERGYDEDVFKTKFDYEIQQFVAWFNETHKTEFDLKADTSAIPDITGLMAKAILEAAGDIIYASGASTPTRLAKGTAGQVLTMNAGATAPEWKTPSAAAEQSCRVYHSTTQSTGGSAAALNFDSETFDTNTMHDNSTNNSRITCKVTGKYIVIGTAAFTPNATGARGLQIRKNGSDVLGTEERNNSGSTLWTFVRITEIVSLSANDYVELTAYQSSGTSLDVDEQYFTVVKIA
jgi:hypothetical protein